jgi:hypothetical protein
MAPVKKNQNSKPIAAKRPKAKPQSRAQSVPAAFITSRPKASNPRALPGRRDTFSGTDLLVNDLAGATTFSASKYQINPGLSTLKGLEGYAARYDKYRFRKFEMIYVPKQAVSTTKGMVHLAYDLNPVHGAPTALNDLSVYEFHDYTQVYGELHCHLPASRLEKKRFVRCGPAPGAQQLYDPFSCIIAVDAMADTTAVGDVFVHYEIEFFGRQLGPSVVSPQSCAMLNLSSAQAMTNSTAATVAFDETIVDTIGVSNSSGVLTLGCGAYQIDADVNGNNTAGENTRVIAELYKNSAALAPRQLSAQQQGAGNESYVSCSFFVQCDADDTIEIKATIVGATGTLTLVEDSCRIRIKSI